MRQRCAAPAVEGAAAQTAAAAVARGVAAAATPAAPSGTTAAREVVGCRFLRPPRRPHTGAGIGPRPALRLRPSGPRQRSASPGTPASPPRRRVGVGKMREGGRAGRGAGEGSGAGAATGVVSIRIRLSTSRHKLWKPDPSFLMRLSRLEPTKQLALEPLEEALTC